MRRNDLIAGASVAGLMLPEAVAYAGIAGLAPQRAILAAIVGCIVYAVFGRSRFAIVSPTSSSAAILAAMLASLSGSAIDAAILATAAVAFAGLLFLLAAAAGLGSLAGFISRPVLRGFAFGLAITIILRQLPNVVGVPVEASDILHLLAALFRAVPQWNPISIATGTLTLAILLALRRVPSVPGALLVLGLGIAISMLFRLPEHGVATVGLIDAMSWPSLTHLVLPDMSRLAQFSVPLALILFAESWGTIRALALQRGDTADANRELRALGFANLASALVQGMPVGAGFSASSANESAGASSKAAAVVAAAGLAILILCFSGLIAHLPQPVLAAVVIAALTHALNPAPLMRLWRVGRDQYVAIAAALAVLTLGVLNGMLIAIALSLAAMIRRLASPYLAQLGRLNDGHNFVDLSRHPEAVAAPNVTIWRPAQPLFFANADAVLGEIVSRAQGAGSKAVILSLEESFDLDSTALDALIECDTALRKAGIRLQLARVHDHARDLLAAGGASNLLKRSSYSVDDAVAAVAAFARISEPSHEARY